MASGPREWATPLMTETSGNTDTTVFTAVTDEVTTLTPVTPTGNPEWESYRPKPSTDKVYDSMIRNLNSIAHDASLQACEFMTLASYRDKDKGTAVRYGHLVDATECLEIALTHLAQLKAAVAYRLRIEDDQNTGNGEF